MVSFTSRSFDETEAALAGRPDKALFSPPTNDPGHLAPAVVVGRGGVPCVLRGQQAGAEACPPPNCPRRGVYSSDEPPTGIPGFPLGAARLR